jgi:hypothetical protein
MTFIPQSTLSRPKADGDCCVFSFLRRCGMSLNQVFSCHQEAGTIG